MSVAVLIRQHPKRTVIEQICGSVVINSVIMTSMKVNYIYMRLLLQCFSIKEIRKSRVGNVKYS